LGCSNRSDLDALDERLAAFVFTGGSISTRDNILNSDAPNPVAMKKAVPTEALKPSLIPTHGLTLEVMRHTSALHLHSFKSWVVESAERQFGERSGHEMASLESVKWHRSLRTDLDAGAGGFVILLATREITVGAWK
jgi:hypothetical protein